MSKTLQRWLVRAALCTSAFAAHAQGAQPPHGASAAPPVRLDPLDASASVPALSYRSSFARYRGLVDDKPLSWREANETVARIGGWRVYAREAQQPEAPLPAADEPAAPKPGAAGAAGARPSTPPGPTGNKSP